MQQKPSRAKIKFPLEIISHTAVPKIGETPNPRINQKRSVMLTTLTTAG